MERSFGRTSLVKAATGEEVSAQELGGAVVHCQKAALQIILLRMMNMPLKLPEISWAPKQEEASAC